MNIPTLSDPGFVQFVDGQPNGKFVVRLADALKVVGLLNSSSIFGRLFGLNASVTKRV